MAVLREKYARFASNVVEISWLLRNVTFRAQLFVNHLTINNTERTDHNHLKSQNFWYSICQLVLRKRAQTSICWKFVVLAFDDFKDKFLRIVYSRKDHNIKGHSDCLSAAYRREFQEIEKFTKCFKLWSLFKLLVVTYYEYFTSPLKDWSIMLKKALMLWYSFQRRQPDFTTARYFFFFLTGDI